MLGYLILWQSIFNNYIFNNTLSPVAKMQHTCSQWCWHKICSWQSERSRPRNGSQINNINSKQFLQKRIKKRNENENSTHYTTVLSLSPLGSIKRPLFSDSLSSDRATELAQNGSGNNVESWLLYCEITVAVDIYSWTKSVEFWQDMSGDTAGGYCYGRDKQPAQTASGHRRTCCFPFQCQC